MSKGDKPRVPWSQEYGERYKAIFTACEICDSVESKRREDDIHLCDECNEGNYPQNKLK